VTRLGAGLAVLLALALAGCATAPRESGRDPLITSDLSHRAFGDCFQPFLPELGTSTMVETVLDDGRFDVRVSGSPQDEALERELESCLNGFRFSDRGMPGPFSPWERLVLGAYQQSVLTGCLADHGVPYSALDPGALDDDEAVWNSNPYPNMPGDLLEVAELRQDCPPYPSFLERTPGG
jgi:hypothetical protein